MSEMITVYKDGKEAVCRKGGAHHAQFVEQGWSEEEPKSSGRRSPAKKADKGAAEE